MRAEGAILSSLSGRWLPSCLASGEVREEGAWLQGEVRAEGVILSRGLASDNV